MAIKYTKEVLEAAVKRSTSLSGVLRALGFWSYSGAMSVHIRKRLAVYGIDTSHFLGMAHQKGRPSNKRKTPQEILVTGKEYRTGTDILRRCLLELGVPHQCAVCGHLPMWNGGPLTLQVDHINGDWSDDRLENLRFICPNCHSQQLTSINQPTRPLKRCAGCDTPFRGPLTQRFCTMKCAAKHKRRARGPNQEKAKWPVADILRVMVWSEPVEDVAKSLGVSGRAVHKRCKRLGINTPPRGYWQKLRAGKLEPRSVDKIGMAEPPST
jgi:hypothetical protein